MIKEISTLNAPVAIGPYSQAKIIGNIIFTSGQIALDPQTGEISGSDIKTQTEQVIKNISEILKVANSSLENVVKTTCFIANMNDFADFNEIYGKYFISKPARSCIEADKLPKNALCEIEVVAVLEN